MRQPMIKFRNQVSPVSRINRRSFLQYAGVSAVGVAFVSAGCQKEEKFEGFYLGSGDVGLLNYLYVLEQLEAAFYTQLTGSFYSGATEIEKALLSDIRDHEIAHREFFKNALGQVAIPTFEANFTTVNFGSRESVLATAKIFEDVVVSAYNGSGAFFKESKYLTLASQIVSVEARHAALIRNLIATGSFANNEVIDANGLDNSQLPSEVLVIVQPYIKAEINATDLPDL